MERSEEINSDLLAVMADGIGDLCFASEQWVALAAEVLTQQVAEHADALRDAGAFTLCEVAYNPPAYLDSGRSLSWYAKFENASVEVGVGELSSDECDFKIVGDHSALSNMARIVYQGSDSEQVAAAQLRLGVIAKWDVTGSRPANPALASLIQTLHDTMAQRTMPRFVFMTPEWVAVARYILTTRAQLEKYAEDLKSVDYTFSEEFINTPSYAFPDGAHGGFWVRCDHGKLTVGAGPLPKDLEPADYLTKGDYTPIIPVGRTVLSAMTDEELAEQEAYRKTAFRFLKDENRSPVEQSSPSGVGDMPVVLAKVFKPLHDELSKRTSGELPTDFGIKVKPQWSSAPAFDRRRDYDASFLNYHKVDIYGQPIDA